MARELLRGSYQAASILAGAVIVQITALAWLMISLGHDTRIDVTPRANVAVDVGGARQNGCVSNPELITAARPRSVVRHPGGPDHAPDPGPQADPRHHVRSPRSRCARREGALLPGWDGIVRSDVADPHVPLGTSGWELGTSKDPRDKAQSDIRHRTEDPLGLDPKTTTFVAVTSRFWRDRDDWRNARRKDRPWADVRAYDADDLVTWLERAPSVHHWISEQLGREPRDVRTPDTWWDRWISQTRVVLPRGFLLAGRDTVVTQIRDALGQPPRPITVVAPSREEALAIVCASLLGDGDGDEVDELRARAVIVSAPGAWDRLVDSAQRPRAHPELRRRRHRVRADARATTS